jgi:hypothetical protein
VSPAAVAGCASIARFWNPDPPTLLLSRSQLAPQRRSGARRAAALRRAPGAAAPLPLDTDQAGRQAYGMTKALGVRSVICALTAAGLLLGAPAIASAASGSSAQALCGGGKDAKKKKDEKKQQNPSALCGGDKKDTKKKDDKKTPDQPSFR